LYAPIWQLSNLALPSGQAVLYCSHVQCHKSSPAESFKFRLHASAIVPPPAGAPSHASGGVAFLLAGAGAPISSCRGAGAAAGAGAGASVCGGTCTAPAQASGGTVCRLAGAGTSVSPTSWVPAPPEAQLQGLRQAARLQVSAR
jgi:hypothetical protein